MSKKSKPRSTTAIPSKAPVTPVALVPATEPENLSQRAKDIAEDVGELAKDLVHDVSQMAGEIIQDVAHDVGRVANDVEKKAAKHAST